MRQPAEIPQPVEEPSPSEAGRPVAGRRPYSPPRLIEWGTLLELTAGGRGAVPDFDFISTKAV